MTTRKETLADKGSRGFMIRETEQKPMMRLLDASLFDAITAVVGDTPFSVTARFFLQRHACDVFADDGERPRYVVIVPHTLAPEVYVFGPEDSSETDALRDPSAEFCLFACFLRDLEV